MSKKWIAIAVAAVLVLGSASVAFARFQGRAGHGRMGMFGEWKMAQLEARLKLTPEQSKQMRDIVANRRDKLVEDFDAGRQDRQALIREIFKDNPNQAEIEKRVSAIQERHNAMLAQLVASGQEFNKTLTPAQRAEMQQVISEQIQVGDKMREHRRQRRMLHSPEGTAPKPDTK